MGTSLVRGGAHQESRPQPGQLHLKSHLRWPIAVLGPINTRYDDIGDQSVFNANITRHGGFTGSECDLGKNRLTFAPVTPNLNKRNGVGQTNQPPSYQAERILRQPAAEPGQFDRDSGGRRMAEG